MQTQASPFGWTGYATRRHRGPRRGLEVAGIVLGFVFAWPLALAYLVWKFAGYPYATELKARLDGVLGTSMPFAQKGYAPTGNAAFEEYRRAELARLEEERRRLDDEARAFTDFVEELKRAKDREEFEAFKARRNRPAA
jgi:hypothetical protein